MITGGSDGDSGAAAIFSKISKEYREKLEVERIMFAVLLALYGLLVLTGTLVAALAGQGHRWKSATASPSPDWAQDRAEREAMQQEGTYARSADEEYRRQEKAASSQNGGGLDSRSHHSIDSRDSRQHSPAEGYDLSEDHRQMRWAAL